MLVALIVLQSVTSIASSMPHHENVSAHMETPSTGIIVLHDDIDSVMENDCHHHSCLYIPMAAMIFSGNEIGNYFSFLPLAYLSYQTTPHIPPPIL